MNCPNCNSENRGEAKFCRHCGVDLTAIESDDSGRSAAAPDEWLKSESLESIANQVASFSASQVKQGDIITGRYQILDSRNSQENGASTYAAIDLLTCPTCGRVNMADDEFCSNCGSQLGISYTAVTLRPVDTIVDAEAQAEDPLEINGIPYAVLRPAQDVPDAPSRQRLQLLVGMQSHIGKFGAVDEDSLLALELSSLTELANLPLIGIFAVADGMGGHESGEIASNLAVRTYAKKLVEKVFTASFEGVTLDQEQLIEEVKQAVLAANQAILDFNPQSEIETSLGSTITAVLIFDQTAIVANVGDSRTYLLRSGQLSKQTQDHSLVARLIEQGVLTEQEAAIADEKNIILRSLGDKSDLEVDIFVFELQAGDRLLLCCDGLWEALNETVIEDILLAHMSEAQKACDELVTAANLAGGTDDISAIIIDLLPQLPLVLSTKPEFGIASN